MYTTKERIAGLPVYQPGKPIQEVKREYNLTDVVKLASNENPFGYSPNVREAIAKAVEDLAMYPDGAARDLKEKIAQHYAISPENIILGNGSDELVSLVTRAFLEPGSQTIMGDLTFPRYKTNSEIEGAEVIEVPLRQGRYDLSKMLEAITPRTRVIWVCNPNNPTGSTNHHEEFLSFMKQLPENVLVVSDEAYWEYVMQGDYPDTLHLMGEFPNLLILRTFSKIYGLAGLRVGYGLAHPAVVDLLNRVREPFNVNHIAQSAAMAAMEDQYFVAECRRRNREGMRQILREIHLLGLTAFPSEANFLLIDLKQYADPIFKSILREGVIVRSGVALGAPQTLRVTIGSEAQNCRFISALQKALEANQSEKEEGI